MDQENTEQQDQFDESGDKIIRVRQLTTEQKLYMQRAKQRHRDNLTKDQIVQGKVFKGSAFISKPQKITFKDFTLHKPHTLTIHLTNVSNAFNSFNVLPLPQHIRNFFQVEFTPHGKISPGLSCPITFKFTPIVNEDIFDEFSILAETGRISYPIECTSRKTIVVCEGRVLEFGDVIYGEKGRRDLVVRNQGSLGSQWEVRGGQGERLEGKVDGQLSEEVRQKLKQLSFNKTGQINGNCQLRIPIQFIPQHIGDFTLPLQLHLSNFKHSPPILLTITARCVQVPIYTPQPFHDLQLCPPNHIYRRKLIFNNRSDNSMKVQLIQPQQTRKFFQFNPMMAFVQNRASIEVWVKVVVEEGMAEYLEKWRVGGEGEEAVYEVEFKLVGADQVMPVPFKIRLQTTTTKLIVKPTVLNFGDLDQGTSSKITVSYQNKSDLPQSLLFYPIPRGISFQNNQPQISLLPRQSLTRWLLFKTQKLIGTKSKKQQGSLVCKVITGNLQTNQLRFNYSAVTKQPQLMIEPNKIDMPALQQGESANTYFEIRNQGGRQLTFQVMAPYAEVTGLKMTPQVKTLAAGQVVQVSLEYEAGFRRVKAMTMRELEEKYRRSKVKPPPSPVKELPPVDPPKKETKKETKDTKKQPKLTKQQQEQLEAEQRLAEQQEKERIERERIERENLEKSFDMVGALREIGGKIIEFPESQSQYYEWLIPVCYKGSGASSNNTTFISVSTTTTQKKLILDQTVVDFGQVAVGTRKVKEIKITSQSDEPEELNKTQIPVYSGFTVLNSLRMLTPGKSFTIVVEFQPSQELMFEELLRLSTGKYRVSCTLKGKGMRPEVKIQPEGGLLNLGSVLLDEQSEKSFKIKNPTNFQLKFNLAKRASGLKNTSPLNPITYIPSEGFLQPNKDVEIKIKFKPDRVGQKFYDLVHILVPEQRNQKRIFIWGNCYSRQAYVAIHKPQILFKAQDLPKKVDSLYDPTIDTVFTPTNNRILLQFTKNDPTQSTQPQSCYKRKLVLGSCKLLDPKLQKPTNFQITMPKDDRFTCDNLKGTAAPGAETIVTFTFKPPEIDQLIAKMDILVGMGQWKDVKVQLKLSGGFAKPGVADVAVYEVILRAYINQL